MPNITLLSADGETFVVDLDVLKYSMKIKELVEEMGIQEKIPVDVNSSNLKMVIEWATEHKDRPVPNAEETKGRKVEPTNWEKEFLKKLETDPGALFEIILAANALDINRLVDLTCEAVATMLKGKSVPDIQAAFKIPTGAFLDPVTEAQVRKENEWCEEK